MNECSLRAARWDFLDKKQITCEGHARQLPGDLDMHTYSCVRVHVVCEVFFVVHATDRGTTFSVVGQLVLGPRATAST